MINRAIYQDIKERLSPRKAVLILGPRQSGKSTLVNVLAKETGLRTTTFNGDDPEVRAAFAYATTAQLRTLVGNAELLVIDEAQRIQNIGLAIKIIIDQIGTVPVIATGSSAFDLGKQMHEPLTGRKWEYNLLPLSFAEMTAHSHLLLERGALEKRMLYGWYPEVVMHPGSEKDLLIQLADSYLYKDILAWENIQKPQKLQTLLQALALQVGKEVSLSELGKMVELDKATVDRYITLLEKAFVVFRVGSYSRNLRNELKNSRKIFFYDTGIRNAVINQFSPVGLRQDIGALWENFWIAERVKFLRNTNERVNGFFWRTHALQEIDWIEEKDGMLQAYECKWNASRQAKVPGSFLQAYPYAISHVINPDNFHEYLLPQQS